MFHTYNLRPDTTQAIRVTTRNYPQVADYIRDHIADDRGVDVTAPTYRAGHRAYLRFTARDAAPHVRGPVTVSIPGFLTVSDHDGTPYYQGVHPDQFTDQYAPAPAPATHVGTDPDFADTPRATAAVQAITRAGLPLAHLFGPHNTDHPDDYVHTHGLLVRPLVGRRVRVDHTQPDGPTAPSQLDAAADALAADGFTLRDIVDGYVIATPPDDDA